MQPIDAAILYLLLAVCAAIALLVLAGPKPKGQYHAHPENLTDEKLTERAQRLRAVAGTDYRERKR